MEAPVLEPGDLLTIPETIDILKVSRSSIYQMIRDGLLETVHIPTRRGARGAVRVKRDSLERLVGGSRPDTAHPEDAESILTSLRASSWSRWERLQEEARPAGADDCRIRPQQRRAERG